MNSKRKQRISSLYDRIHVMFWAGLVATVVFFVVYDIPRIKAVQAQSEATRILEIAAEDEGLCVKLGIGTGTPTHDRCVGAVQEFRAALEKRIKESSDFIF